MRLIPTCPICKVKNVTEKSHSTIGKTRFITLDCGHTYTEKLLVGRSNPTAPISDDDSIYLADGRKLYQFQVTGVRFIEQSNFKCLIADEMGLGKTIQAIAAINLHFDELKPILIVCKSSLTHNWLREFVSGTKRIAQVFESGDRIIPGIGVVIVSFDTLIPRKIRGDEFKVDDSNLRKILEFKPKTVILDEVQAIKNHNAKRTNAIRDIIRGKIPKRHDPTTPLKQSAKRIEIIARDLMHHHDLDKRFKLTFDNSLRSDILGLTGVKSGEDGLILGEIIINKYFAEHSNEDEVIGVVLHEIAHAITPGAGHRGIWRDTSLSIGGDGKEFVWCEGTIDASAQGDLEDMVKYPIALSGTPIKNNALEYFPILNLLRPEIFPSLGNFERLYVDYYFQGNSYKAGGLKYPEEFKQKTRDFIIRRTREEARPELPRILRDFKFYPLSDEVKKAYNKKVKALDEFLRDGDDNKNSQFYTELIAHLSILRHITGIAKIAPVLEFVNEFIVNETNGEEKKLTIFHHHVDVGDLLSAKLDEMLGAGKVIRITSADSSETRLDKIEQFKSGSERIMLIPTLAGGEGINLQFCSQAIIMEREWNPANEEQAEGRFSRIGSTANSVSVTYPTATGTIDEYFAEIVERKRQIVDEALDGEKKTNWDNSSIMLELANVVVKKWRLN